MAKLDNNKLLHWALQKGSQTAPELYIQLSFRVSWWISQKQLSLSQQKPDLEFPVSNLVIVSHSFLGERYHPSTSEIWQNNVLKCAFSPHAFPFQFIWKQCDSLTRWESLSVTPSLRDLGCAWGRMAWSLRLVFGNGLSQFQKEELRRGSLQRTRTEDGE